MKASVGLVFSILALCACSSSGSSGGGNAGGGGGGGQPTGGTAGNGGAIGGGGGIAGAASGGLGGSGGGQSDAGFDVMIDAPTIDGGDKSQLCTDQFGNALTDSFGRVDGTVLALVAPNDAQCALVNNDHLVIEVSMQGAVYRMVVNVSGVLFAETDAKWFGSPWADGWHTNAQLDYPSALGLKSSAFTPYAMYDLIAKIEAQIEIGAAISVFAVSSGGTYADSAHLIHRNGSGRDGAIVVNPLSATPHYLAFRFDDQSF